MIGNSISIAQIKKMLKENLFLVFTFIFIFFVYQHGDITSTAKASINLFHASYLKFYDDTVAVCGWPLGGINYLSSTYILFSLWSVPLKLLGLAPPPGGEINGLVFWYKLLPTIFYFFSAYLIKLLAKDILKDEASAGQVAKLWLISPIAFFSQFIFGQYDSFTLFFTLLGMVFYFKKDLYKFSLFMGIALTFKYFPVFVFVPLLLMVEKRLKELFRCGLIFSIPMILIAGPFLLEKSPAFLAGVIGFGAAHRVFGVEFSNGISSFGILFFLWFILCAYVFFFEEKWIEFRERAIRYSTFVVSGLFFLIFWHPQWLLFMTPFIHLSCMSKKTFKMYLIFQILLGIAFTAVTVNFFNFNVDQTLIRMGIFGEWFPQVWGAKVAMMSNFIYPRDGSMWLSLFNALLIIGSIFSFRTMRADTEMVTAVDFSENRSLIKAYTGINLWFFAGIGLICYVILVIRWIQIQ